MNAMKVVLTGSSSGIGQALAQHLAAAGHEVWGLARSVQNPLPVKGSGAFHPCRADVASWESASAAARDVGAAAKGRIDAVITCAGIQGEVGPAMAADPRLWAETVRANLEGTYFTLRAFHALLAPQSPGARAKVLCFSGGGATKARPNFTAYGAAKTAIVRLVETLGEEWKGTPVDINAIAPGAINTRMTDELLALGPDKVGRQEWESANRQKAQGGGSMDKVIALVDFLLSPQSDHVSGRLLAAQWDNWADVSGGKAIATNADVYTLRRITP